MVLIIIDIKALPKFLQCVDWASLEQVTETHKLLQMWSPITMEVRYMFGKLSSHMFHIIYVCLHVRM